MHEQLEKYLDALRRDECYRVDAVLKSSTFEITERVYFVGQNGSEQGPYVRKRFAIDSGMGEIYQRIRKAQDEGQRFVHLPRILDCYDTERERVIVMEFVYGETLSDLIYRNDPSIELALGVFRELCDAVEELHERFNPPIIHRDLKPSNIMLSSKDLTIIDLGIARTFDSARTEDTRNLGTRNYAPPEQFGFGQTSVRSDIYSMGMVLYYCLTEKTPMASLTETGFDDPAIPTPLQPVLTKATKFDPRQRYGSIAEMRKDFEQAANLIENSESDLTVAPTFSFSGKPTDALVSSASKRSRKSTHSFAGAPRWVGIVWNVNLIFWWLLVQIINIGMILEPSESYAVYQPWGRWIMGIGAIAIPFTLVSYGLVDKRYLAKHFPVIERWRWSIQLIASIVVSLAFMLVAGAICQMALIG